MARNNPGNVLKAEGDLDGAAATYRETLVIKPDAMEAHFNLGVVLELQGKHDEAIGRYRAALALEPDSVAVLYTLGNAFSNQAAWNQAAARRPRPPLDRISARAQVIHGYRERFPDDKSMTNLDH